MTVRRMRLDDLDAAVGVWRDANIARGAPHGPGRTARVCAKLTAPDALSFVALRPGVVGMALAEPARFDDGAGELDPSLLHISMVFVHPAAQRTGIGHALLVHLIDIARTTGRQRVDVWTAEANGPARKLYERVGMTLTGRTEPGRYRLHLQYGMRVGRADPAPPARDSRHARRPSITIATDRRRAAPVMRACARARAVPAMTA
jgi:ribosomal protein S18 acetylase RimI-like enzyme